MGPGGGGQKTCFLLNKLQKAQKGCFKYKNSNCKIVQRFFSSLCLSRLTVFFYYLKREPMGEIRSFLYYKTTLTYSLLELLLTTAPRGWAVF